MVNYNVVDPIASMGGVIERMCGKVSSDIFYNHPIIQQVLTADREVQRVAISRWLSILLLAFSTYAGVNINGYIIFANNIGDPDEWVAVVEREVMPFVSRNNVIVESYKYLT